MDCAWITENVTHLLQQVISTFPWLCMRLNSSVVTGWGTHGCGPLCSRTLYWPFSGFTALAKFSPIYKSDEELFHITTMMSPATGKGLGNRFNFSYFSTIEHDDGDCGWQFLPKSSIWMKISLGFLNFENWKTFSLLQESASHRWIKARVALSFWK